MIFWINMKIMKIWMRIFCKPDLCMSQKYILFIASSSSICGRAAKASLKRSPIYKDHLLRRTTCFEPPMRYMYLPCY